MCLLYDPFHWYICFKVVIIKVSKCLSIYLFPNRKLGLREIKGAAIQPVRGGENLAVQTQVEFCFPSHPEHPSLHFLSSETKPSSHGWVRKAAKDISLCPQFNRSQEFLSISHRPTVDRFSWSLYTCHREWALCDLSHLTQTTKRCFLCCPYLGR